MKDMPPVAQCEATDCFFNRTQQCHAPAINVGEHPHVESHQPGMHHFRGEMTTHEGEHPHTETHRHTPGHHQHCITYEAHAQHIARDAAGAVGACHVSECRYNDDLTCAAHDILVVVHEHHADCGTFDPRA